MNALFRTTFILSLALVAFLVVEGAAFAGCGSTTTTRIYTSPLTGKRYNVETKTDLETSVTTITAKELGTVTTNTWRIFKPQIKVKWDIGAPMTVTIQYGFNAPSKK